MKSITLSLMLLFFTTLEVLAEKQNIRPEYKIFFIGNSLTYYNDVPSMVSTLISATDKNIKVKIDVVAQGGYSLAQHLSLPLIHKTIANKKYDFVVIQDFGGWPFCSYSIPSCSQNNDSIEEMIKIIRVSGAIPLWYSTYQQNSDVQKSMSIKVNAIAKELNVKVADVGASLQKYIKINNKDTVFSNDGHLSYTGSLVAAATIVQNISIKFPKKIQLNEICTNNWRGRNLLASKLISEQPPKSSSCKKISQKRLNDVILAGQYIE